MGKPEAIAYRQAYHRLVPWTNLKLQYINKTINDQFFRDLTGNRSKICIVAFLSSQPLFDDAPFQGSFVSK